MSTQQGITHIIEYIGQVVVGRAGSEIAASINPVSLPIQAKHVDQSNFNVNLTFSTQRIFVVSVPIPFHALSACHMCVSVSVFVNRIVPFAIFVLALIYLCALFSSHRLQLSTTVDTPPTAASVGTNAERQRTQSSSQIRWSAACGQQHYGG